MLTLAYKATSVVGKRKTTSVKKLKNKLKISKIRAAQLSGILTQEGIFEVQGLKGPLIKLAGNGLSVAFLVITWSQLYAVDVYGLVEILGIVSTGFSAALILGVLLQYWTTRKLQKHAASFEASAPPHSPASPPSTPSLSPEEQAPEVSDSSGSSAVFGAVISPPDLGPLGRAEGVPMPEDSSCDPFPTDTPHSPTSPSNTPSLSPKDSPVKRSKTDDDREDD